MTRAVTREVAHEAPREADTTLPEHHVIYLRNVTCGLCRDRAGEWMRCATCKQIVARCGLHNRDLQQQTKEHCRG